MSGMCKHAENFSNFFDDIFQMRRRECLKTMQSLLSPLLHCNYCPYRETNSRVPQKCFQNKYSLPKCPSPARRPTRAPSNPGPPAAPPPPAGRPAPGGSGAGARSGSTTRTRTAARGKVGDAIYDSFCIYY